MELRNKVFKWSVLLTVTRWVQQLVRVASFIILARLLDPQDYGIATLAQAPIGLLALIAGAGMATALVSTRAEIGKAAPHGLILTLCVAAFSSTIAVVFAPQYAHALGQPELTDVCRAMAILILFDGLYAVPRAVLSRAMNFGWIALADTVSTFTGIGVAISLAYLGYGYWSLAWWLIVASALRFVIVVWKSPKRMWLRLVPWDGALAYQLGRSGLSTTGTNFLFYAYTNGDSLVIGKLYDPVTLGYYTQGFRIANLPILMFYSALDHVLLPAYASIRDEKERVARALLSSYRLLTMVLLPAAVGLLILAPELVIVLVGEKWRESIPFLQVFAVQGFARSIHDNFLTLCYGIDRPHYTVLSALVIMVTIAVAILIVIVFELPALAIAFAVLSGYMAGLVIDLLLLRYGAKLPIRATDFVRQTLPVMLSAAAMALFVLGAKHLIVMSFGSAATVPLLLILVLTATVVYSVALFAIKPDWVREVLDLVLAALGRRGSSAEAPYIN
ncbi:lipopolysaccharide biosynthesis protein [soil metagenome]